MVTFSELRQFRLRDEGGSEARLRDLAVDLSARDYPPVTRVVFRAHHGHHAHVDWNEVHDIDWQKRCMRVTDLSRGVPLADDPLEKRALLDRDVLDALVLDLANRQSMRANDLWIEQNEGALELRAADIGVWAIVRRLARGMLHQTTRSSLLDWRDVEFLRGDPAAARAGNDYHRRVGNLQPSEIARLLDGLPYLHAAELLELLEENLAADALEVMRRERQVQVFDEWEDSRRVRLLELMAPEHAADLLGYLGPGEAQRCLEMLPEASADRILQLLRFADDTAGGIMTNQVIVVEEHLRVAQARDAIRDQLKRPDFVYYVYVVDTLEAGRLRGIVTLRDLLVADRDDPLRKVMRTDMATLNPEMPAEAAAWRVADQHLAALPVVNDDGRLLGAVTADAALLQIAPPSISGQEPRVFT
jgi:magnesium transporter